MYETIYVGLDPSAGPQRKSGICLLNRQKEILYIGRWNKMEEISDILAEFPAKFRLIAIDGPLRLPYELKECCFRSQSKCNHRQTTPFKGRYCEILLIKKGYRCFLTSKNSFVKSWILRCLKLDRYLQKNSFSTIEVFPFATRRILFPQLTGKKHEPKFRLNLGKSLEKWGLPPPKRPKLYTHDELDAVLAAITAWHHDMERTDLIGDERDGYIVIPRLSAGNQ